MDEGTHLSQNWEVETIPDEDYVLRSVPVDFCPLYGTKRIPNEAAFQVKKDDKGLSVNWEKYMTIRDNYILLGLTFSKKQKFINYTSFKIFKLEVGYVRSLSEVEGVIHDPVFNGDPPQIGKPNNRAHSLILCSDDEEVRMNLSDYCMNNFDISYCNYNLKKLSDEITALQKRLTG